MNVIPELKGCKVNCTACPLQSLPLFRRFRKEETEFLVTFKMGELNAEPGATILAEQSHSAHLYTVLSGVGFRYKALEDGRRQIMNFVFPGDLVGLQGSIMGEMQHSVEVLSPMLLCVFERSRLDELFRGHPSLAFDITWIAAREERILDEHLLGIGRRDALERTAYLLAYLFLRARAVGLTRRNRLMIPVTQAHLADALGLSPVHTNRTLKRLSQRGVLHWRDRGCEVLDEERLLGIAQWEGPDKEPRPYI